VDTIIAFHRLSFLELILLYTDEDSSNGNAKWLSALRDAVHHQCANKLEGKAGHQHFPKIGQVRILFCEIIT
jgi:hypothetical protein